MRGDSLAAGAYMLSLGTASTIKADDAGAGILSLLISIAGAVLFSYGMTRD